MVSPRTALISIVVGIIVIVLLAYLRIIVLGWASHYSCYY